MTNETPFSADGTVGYTKKMLAELNATWVRRGGPEIDDESEASRLAERIQREYDVEHPIQCLYCDTESAPQGAVPAAGDVEAWDRLATAHDPACEWIATRAHRRDHAR